MRRPDSSEFIAELVSIYAKAPKKLAPDILADSETVFTKKDKHKLDPQPYPTACGIAFPGD